MVTKSRRMKWAGQVARMGDEKFIEGFFGGGGGLEGKEPRGRSTRTREVNILKCN